MEEKGLRVDQKVSVLTKDPNSAEKSKFSGQEQELDEIDPIGTDTMIVSQGSIFLENDVHSTYEFEITGNTNNFLGISKLKLTILLIFQFKKLIGLIVFRPKTSSIYLRAKRFKKIIIFSYQKTL